MFVYLVQTKMKLKKWPLVLLLVLVMFDFDLIISNLEFWFGLKQPNRTIPILMKFHHKLCFAMDILFEHCSCDRWLVIEPREVECYFGVDFLALAHFLMGFWAEFSMKATFQLKPTC